jgi:hypothetical protein
MNKREGEETTIIGKVLLKSLCPIPYPVKSFLA